MKTMDSLRSVAVKLNDSLETSVNDVLDEEIISKVNALFTEDLKCPKLTPFSPLRFSCNSETSCKEVNHMLPVAQLTSGDEKVLLLLACAKYRYLLLAPLSSHITQRCYLSPLIFRSVFFGILDEHDEKTCLALVDILKKHLLLHPPCRSDLKMLYHDVLLGEIIIDEHINSNVKYDFHAILSNIEDTCKNIINVVLEENQTKTNKPEQINFSVPSSTKDMFSFITQKYIDNDNILSLPEFNFQKSDNEGTSGNVDLHKQLKRLFLVFSIMLDILEEDFRMWWMQSKYNLQERLNSETACPLIALVSWKKTEVKGSINEHCLKVFKVFKSCPQKYKHHISRYIAILFGVACMNENNEEKKFPFFGSLCRSFANEVYCHVKGADDKVSLVQLIYPDWLRFKVVGCLLRSDITSGGIDDLSSVYRILLRNLSKKENNYLPSKSLRNKLKLPNLKGNIKNSEGETLIHKYCRTNNIKALKQYIQYPDTNVNLSDNVGWTALHNAATYNSIDSVKMLLKYRLPPIRGAEELNLFLVNKDNESPLMCAVKKENVEIVDILLKNGAGPTIWNINTKGESSIDMATNDSIKEMLLNSWKNSTSSFQYLKMNEEDVELLTIMLSSYCNVYHVKEKCEVLDKHSNMPDGFYNYSYDQYLKDEKTFDRLSFLVDKLVQEPSNPKNLKYINFFFKSFSL